MEDLLTEREAAEILRLKPTTLKKWRVKGRGPAFLRLGTAIRYPLSALQRFVDDAMVLPQGE